MKKITEALVRIICFCLIMALMIWVLKFEYMADYHDIVGLVEFIMNLF